MLGKRILMRIRRRVGVLVRRVVPTGAERRAMALAREPGREVVVRAGQRVVVLPTTEESPWRIAARTADEVRQSLESARVPFFANNLPWTRNTQWAVRRQDLGAVLDQLKADSSREPYYLMLGKGDIRLVWAGLHLNDIEPLHEIKVFRYLRNPTSGNVHSWRLGATLSIWDVDVEGVAATKVKSGVVQAISADDFTDVLPVPRWDGVLEPRLAGMAGTPTLSEIDFPVDAVYLWVDDSDAAWRTKRDRVRARMGMDPLPQLNDETVAAHRYRDRGELLASLRSLEHYAPWIRNIYLVTDDQVPTWLDTAHSRVKIVDHREIFADTSVLPTYNSHAIGSQVFRIPDLAEHYLLMNDDVMFSSPMSPYDFFTPQGQLRVNLSRSQRPLIPRDLQTSLERARENSARLIEERFGRRPTHLFAHVPVPQLRSVASEVDEVFAAEIKYTVAQPFRTSDDVVVNSWLHLYYAMMTGRAVRGDLAFGYFNIGNPSMRERMDDDGFLGRFQVICLNDVPPEDPADDADPVWLSEWLAKTFPFKAPFEKA